MSKPYLQHELITLYNDDFLKIEEIKDGSIDLIVTSPPYNLSIEYDTIDDGLPYEDYLKFTANWMKKCFKLVKNGGRVCLNIPLDINKGGQQSVYADLTTIAKQVGWKYYTTIIWNKQPASGRVTWGSWMSASAPCVIAPVEVIIILYKKNWKKQSLGKSDTTKEEFMSWTDGVWSFHGESRKKVGHPTPFPIHLPERCIKLFSFVEDTVLDPFVGSGTTLVACFSLQRKGIGVEISEKYCHIARERLKSCGLFMVDLREWFR